MKANVIFIGKKQHQKMSDSLACQVSLTSLTILLGMIHTSSFKASLQKTGTLRLLVIHKPR